MAIGDRHHHRADLLRSARQVYIGAGFHQRANRIHRTIARGIQQRRCATALRSSKLTSRTPASATTSTAVGGRSARGRRNRRGWLLGRHRAGIGLEPDALHRGHFRGRIRVCTLCDQCANCTTAILVGGEHEGGLLTRLFFNIHIRAVLHQRIHRFSAARGGSHHQRCDAGLICGVHIRARSGEGLHHGAVPRLTGKEQRRHRAQACCGPHIRLCSQQRLRHGQIAVSGGPMQRRHTIALRRIHIGFLRDQRANQREVPALCRIGNRRRSCAERNRAKQDDCKCAHYRTTSPVLSPILSTSTPSLCIIVSSTFAIGVPSGVMT